MNTGRLSKQSFFIISVLLLSAGLTFSRTITVGIGLGYDYSSIQPAIDAALNGDTVIVAQGTYNEAINFKGKNIILTSIDPNDTGVVAHTIIGSSSFHSLNTSIVTFSGQENESCVLRGFTITRGNPAYGGGITGNRTKATIRNCHISNNRSVYGGGIYYCGGLIENCTISSNTASGSGGGIYSCDGMIENCTISNNEASDDGGGLCGCDGTVRNCTIQNNVATNGQGGGLSNCYCDITGCTITKCTSKGNGGGLNKCNGIIEDCLISENKSTDSGGGGLYNCNKQIISCTIENNSAPVEGGGLYNCSSRIINCMIQYNSTSGKGGGLFGCNRIISGCTIRGNTTTGSSGGGLANCIGPVADCNILGNTSPLWHAGGAIDCNSFTNCVISGNMARGYGGGLYNCKKVANCKISGNSSEIYPGGGIADCNSVMNCIISGNTAGGVGGGLYDCNEIINCTIVGNSCQKNAAAVYFKGDYGIINNCIIWDNIAVDGGQVIVECKEPNTALWNLSIDYSDVQEGQDFAGAAADAVLLWGPNNLDTYPLFKQSGSWNNTTHKWQDGDYHLLESSPCIDAGDPNRDYTDQNDIDMSARVVGQYVDIGADEFQPVILELLQIEISGPQQVTEGDTAQYITIGRYDNDSQVDLTNKVIWSVEPQDVGIVDANGLFIPGELDESTEVTIRATYTPEDQEIVFMAEMTVLCVPAGTKYYVDGAAGSDQNDGLSKQTAFKTINAGIDAAQDGDIVLVYPGVYREAVIFWGKKITVKSADDAAVIENPGNIAVLFCFDESAESVIQNFVIRNSKIGILNVLGSCPTIKNLTVVNNENGIECFNSDPNISNCILWNNSDKDFVNCMPIYSCTEDSYAIVAITTDLNIHSNPLFANPNEGDYHLKSQYGRYSPVSDTWVLDSETSPCIDAGNPEDDCSKEPEPNGSRINMGAYGETSKASISSVSDIRNKASNPNPCNGAVGVNIRPTLYWTAGLNAVSHDVYMGTNNASVSNATHDNPLGVLVSQAQNGTSFAATSYLSYNQLYFWRVDEISSSGSITKGDTWTFITLTAGGKGRSCFIGQIPVWISGEKVEISKVTAGQSVGLSASAPAQEINQLLEHEGTYDLYDIVLDSGEGITVANEHYFMVESGQWISSKDLVAGTNLKTAKGVVRIKSINEQSKPFTGKVYNLDMKNSDTYMVGQDAVIVRDY